MDGCDHYGDKLELAGKWETLANNPEIEGGASSRGGGILKFETDDSSVIGRFEDDQGTLQNVADVIFGCRLKWPILATSDNDAIRLKDGGTAQVSIEFDAAGGFDILSGTGAVNLAPGTITPNVWHHFEMRVIFSDTDGFIEIRVDGQTVVTLVETDTVISGNDFANRLEIRNSRGIAAGDSILQVHDIYCLNVANGGTFLGVNARIDTIRPNGDTADKDFVRSPAGANNFDSLDESIPHNFDTDQVESSTVAHKDVYDFEPMPAGLDTIGPIHGVQVVMTNREDASPVRTMNTIVSHGGTEGDGATTATLTTAWKPYKTLHRQNPDTSAAWQKSEIAAIQAGFEIVA